MEPDTHYVGIVGHRKFANRAKHCFVEWNLHAILRACAKKYVSLAALSALAEGADSLFAQIAIDLQIELVSILPYRQDGSDLGNSLARARYDDLRKNCDREINIDFPKKNDLAHRKAMNMIVYKSNTLVAVWDGRMEGPVGGTWETVKLCMNLRKNFIHLNCAAKSVDLYFNGGTGYSKVSNLESPKISLYI